MKETVKKYLGVILLTATIVIGIALYMQEVNRINNIQQNNIVERSN